MAEIAWTDAEREAAEYACMVARDLHPRRSDDADSAEVVDAVLDVLAPFIAERVRQARAEALREAAELGPDTCNDGPHEGETCMRCDALYSELLDRADAEGGQPRG